MATKLEKETRLYMYLLFSLGILCAQNYGIMASNTPGELINKYAELTNFDVSRPEIFSTMTIGTSIGALIAQFTLKPIVAKLGLFKSLFVFLPLDIIFNIMNCFPVHYLYFLFVMICIGFCTGSYLTLIPILAADQVPPKMRGIYMTTFSINVSLGVVFGYVLSYFVKLNSLEYNNWWAMHLVCVILCIVATAFLYFTYIQKNKLEKLRSQSDSEQATSEDLTQSVIPANASQTDEASREQTLVISDEVDDMDNYTYSCRQKHRLIWISIILGTVQMTTGITAVVNYASIIFKDTFAGNPYSGNYGAMIIGAVKLIGLFIAMPIIKAVDRRILLGIGLMGCVVTNVVIAITFAAVSENSKTMEIIKIVMFVLFQLSYQLSPGPIILMLCGEVFPRSLKVKISSMAFAFNWSWNIILTYTYRFFKNTGYIIHSLYAVVTFILTIALLILIPETRNKSEREIEQIIRTWKR